ncbi:Mitochondrial import inner membrane translocase subunit TIM21 [Neolecta irregularis DAH-3]|uniref:Mitochondrial import inner membrane translocase subunit Tim21 n=1 Tax=Neolecta irregularis (strain DAH-3) TaxID=1198029 RepID=A0A1U7LH21_NEOID|nr:Mitochondrial import inner membrane translocase subunit TIM21 [Neolecta irregularis DAH-3]|eukprot:OLL21955.1 Mitochondrial import inner membrane translocase subunit TIM21 [Neolecta irregularis DAH-3]
MTLRPNSSEIAKSLCKICASTTKVSPKRLHTSTDRPTIGSIKTHAPTSNIDPAYQKWDNLTTKQKAIRTGSYGSNAAVIMLGLGVFGVVAYAFTTYVLLPSSETRLYNKSFDLIRKHPEVLILLGSDLSAHGEATRSRWQKNRPLATQKTLDKANREHLLMRYHVEGELTSGIANLDMVQDSEGNLQYQYLFVDVPELKRRIYIIDNRPQQKPNSGGIFGIFRPGRK